MRRLIATAALLSAISCDEGLTAPSSDDLVGLWFVTSLQPVGAASVTPAGERPLAVNFSENRISLQGDCNLCSGGYTVDGRTLSVSRLACTLRACRPESLDGPFFDLVSSAQTIETAAGPLLLISGPRGRIVLGR